MKVTPNSTMVAPQDDLDLNLVTSRIKRFLTNAIKTLAHYKKVDHTNRHAMEKGETNTEACLIINLFNKNGKARIVADIRKSGLYNVTQKQQKDLPKWQLQSCEVEREKPEVARQEKDQASTPTKTGKLKLPLRKQLS